MGRGPNIPGFKSRELNFINLEEKREGKNNLSGMDDSACLFI